MSFDIMLFKSDDAPRDKQKFSAWYEELVSWKEDYDYNNHEQTDSDLRILFEELIQTFPPLNGPLAPEEVEGDMDAYLSDYSIGENFIYCAFSWSVSEEADHLLMKLAKKYNVGYFGLSGYGDIIYNSTRKNQMYRPLEDGYLVTDEANVADVLLSLHELEDADFIIVDPKPSLQGNVFLQTMKDAEDKYTVETRFELGSDFKQYQKVMTHVEVAEVFKNYLQGSVPDISTWDNITPMLKSQSHKLLN